MPASRVVGVAGKVMGVLAGLGAEALTSRGAKVSDLTVGVVFAEGQRRLH